MKMINFSKFVTEARKVDKSVFTFGRHQPPTIGHQKVFDKVESEAKSQGAQAHIITSHSHDGEKNPLPSHLKKKLIRSMVSPSTKVSSSDSDSPTLLHHLVKMHKAGIKHVTMVAGSDRVNEFNTLINKYNGKTGPHGHYHFDSIKVVSAGHRDPDAEGAEGMSGTKARELAKAGKTEELKKGMPESIHPHIPEIVRHIKNGSGS